MPVYSAGYFPAAANSLNIQDLRGILDAINRARNSGRIKLAEFFSRSAARAMRRAAL